MFRKHRFGLARKASQPRLEVLEDRTVPSGVTIGAMGDSMTAPYKGTSHGSAGDRCWVEQFEALRSVDDVQIYNVAKGGATSTTLLSQGQPNTVADLIASGAVRYPVLVIGANDETQFLPSILAGNPDPFVNTVVPNIFKAAAIVAGSGDVPLVVANLPDIGVTPLFRATVTNDPVLLQRLTDAVMLANQQIESLAGAYHVPVVDLFGLSYLTLGPITIGDVQITNYFAPDGYHPGMVAQGILGNTILAAMSVGYGEDVSSLQLTDQEILDEAGIDHPPGQTYFDVGQFVIYNPGSGLPRTLPGDLVRTSDPLAPRMPVAPISWTLTNFPPTERSTADAGGVVRSDSTRSHGFRVIDRGTEPIGVLDQVFADGGTGTGWAGTD